jgi:UDP-N-acetylmuramyl pentapeptide phosphotransferase/UDP-N-acetylglucosamine-1-phosphate transferase
VDWKVAFHYTLIGAVLIAGVLAAVFIFDAVWARFGFIAAAVLVAVAVFILKKWDDRRAVRDRERFERS